MNITEIQKCQEEYEKLLKESPIQSTIERICRDITDQKNNAMAMEFTRVICDLLRENGIYVHCTETKFSEKITVNSIEEQYGIAFDSMDFSQHDKEFTDKIEELQSEVEKYRKAFENSKKERDCQIAEYQKKVEELEEYADSLKCSIDRKQYAINQIDGIICELFGIAHNGEIYTDDFKELLREKSVAGKTITDFLPTEPIKVADMLINASKKRTNCMTGKEYDKYIFDKWQLRQIAEHLLVYCNHNGEAEE